MTHPAISKQISMRTPAVSRLHVLGRLIEELDKDLDRVTHLRGEVVDKRKYKELDDLVATARTRLTAVRDALAKNGGSVVAKGYK